VSENDFLSDIAAKNVLIGAGSKCQIVLKFSMKSAGIHYLSVINCSEFQQN